AGFIALPARPRLGGGSGSFPQRPASCCGAARRSRRGKASAGGRRGRELSQPIGRHAALDRAEEQPWGHGAARRRKRRERESRESLKRDSADGGEFLGQAGARENASAKGCR